MFGLSKGHVVEVFSGAVPESKVEEFVKGVYEAHYGKGAEDSNAAAEKGENVESAKELLRLGEAAGQKGDVGTAGECFTKILGKEEWKDSHADALCGLGMRDAIHRIDCQTLN